MYDKCIYLDGDVVVSKDLSEFFNISVDDYYVGGVKDRDIDSKLAEVLGIKDKSKYINCGVYSSWYVIMPESCMKSNIEKEKQRIARLKAINAPSA